MTIVTKPTPSQMVEAICNDVRSRMPQLALLEDLKQDQRAADIGPDIALPAIHMHIVLEHLRFLEAAYRVALLHSAPQKMEFAPPGDGWILARVSGTENARSHPWQVITRCDGGWRDAEGYRCEPSAWLALPDPQPAPTGWREATGSIVIDRVTGGQIAWAKFIVSVVLPDGQYDAAREPDLATDHQDACARATKMAVQLGLPVVDMSGDGSINVVPLRAN